MTAVAVMAMLPHPESSPHGRPQVFIEAQCDHGVLVFTYEAHEMALTVLRCSCWREGSRTVVGMPAKWQQAGLGQHHRRWVDA